MNTTNLDVLAILAEVTTMIPESDRPVMREARAAVAELVEAANRATKLRPGGGPQLEAMADLRAALAKFAK